MLSRRNLLASSLAAAVPGIGRAANPPPASPSSPPAPPPRLDAVVGEVPEDVAGDARRFPTIAAALAAAPNTGERHNILIGEGTFTEKVTITRANTALYGLGADHTRIAWDDYSGRAGSDGSALGTRRTATLTVLAPDVQLNLLSVVNSFDYLGQIGLAEGDPKKVHDTQALALAVSAPADRFYADRVHLDGWQDTLFVDSGRAYITNSRISGSVDFIFGAGTVAVAGCEIVSRLMPGKPGQGYVCAPSTLKETPYGFVFFDCRLDHEGEPFPDGSTALARPWRPTTSFPDGRYGNPDVRSACLYLRCQFGDHISGKGFDHMSYNTRGGVKAFNEPEDARFYISGCTGKAVATIPARFTAPDALVAGLTPWKLVGGSDWML